MVDVNTNQEYPSLIDLSTIKRFEQRYNAHGRIAAAVISKDGEVVEVKESIEGIEKIIYATLFTEEFEK